MVMVDELQAFFVERTSGSMVPSPASSGTRTAPSQSSGQLASCVGMQRKQRTSTGRDRAPYAPSTWATSAPYCQTPTGACRK